MKGALDLSLIHISLSDKEADFVSKFHDNSVGIKNLIEKMEKKKAYIFDFNREPVSYTHLLLTMFYAPIILLNSSNNTSFTPPALNTNPTATRATTKKPMSFENSRLNPK